MRIVKTETKLTFNILFKKYEEFSKLLKVYGEGKVDKKIYNNLKARYGNGVFMYPEPEICYSKFFTIYSDAYHNLQIKLDMINNKGKEHNDTKFTNNLSTLPNEEFTNTTMSREGGVNKNTYLINNQIRVSNLTPWEEFYNSFIPLFYRYEPLEGCFIRCKDYEDDLKVLLDYINLRTTFKSGEVVSEVKYGELSEDIFELGDISEIEEDEYIKQSDFELEGE